MTGFGSQSTHKLSTHLGEAEVEMNSTIDLNLMKLQGKIKRLGNIAASLTPAPEVATEVRTARFPAFLDGGTVQVLNAEALGPSRLAAKVIVLFQSSEPFVVTANPLPVLQHGSAGGGVAHIAQCIRKVGNASGTRKNQVFRAST